MDKFKLKQFIWSVILLIIGLALLLVGYYRWALLLIFFGFFGISLRIYVQKKKTKMLSKKWANMYILMMILGLIIISLMFEEKWSTLDIILCGIVLIAIYLYFRFLAPKLILGLSAKEGTERIK